MEFSITMRQSYDIQILCCSYEHSMSYCMFRTEIPDLKIIRLWIYVKAPIDCKIIANETASGNTVMNGDTLVVTE